MEDKEARDILIDELRQKRQPRYLARAYECAIKALDDKIPESAGKTNTRQKKKKEAEIVKEKTVRLIDANVLVEELKKRIRTPRSTLGIVKGIIPLIEAQPVAYDLEEVIQPLQYHADRIADMSKGQISTEQKVRYQGVEKAYREAINIVQHGGIEHE